MSASENKALVTKSQKAMEKFARSDRVADRESLALNLGLTVAVARMLAEDPHPFVRAALASNQAPQLVPVLRYLATEDRSYFVQSALALNPSTDRVCLEAISLMPKAYATDARRTLQKLEAWGLVAA